MHQWLYFKIVIGLTNSKKSGVVLFYASQGGWEDSSHITGNICSYTPGKREKCLLFKIGVPPSVRSKNFSDGKNPE